MVLVIVIVLLILGYCVLNGLYKRTNVYRNPNKDLEGFRAGVPSDIRLANFGSTYGYSAFCAHDVLAGTFNFAMNCESLELDYALLQQYAPCMSRGCIVVLQLNCCVGMYRERMVNQSRKAWVTGVDKALFHLSVKDYLRHTFPLSPIAFRKMARILLDVPETDEKRYHSASVEQAAVTADNLVQGWKRLFHLSSLQSADLGAANVANIEYNTSLVDAFLHLCQERGLRPVVVCPPLGEKLSGQISDTFFNATLGGIAKTASEHRVPFLNYMRDERFLHAPSLYADGCYCLNYKGSQRFIKILLSDVGRFYGISVNNSFLNNKEK